MKGTPVVGIGASLGGLEAVGVLFSLLRSDFPCPIVLIQHRMPHAEGLLVELVQGYCPLPVCEPEDKDPILPGHVYIAPPNYHLLADYGFFSLSLEAPVSFARPSVDVFFESLADSYGSRSLGFFLTGSNRDGADGARAVKRAGGKVFVQDPKTAESAVSPLAVLETTWVDGVMDLSGLSRVLALAGAEAPAARPGPTAHRDH
ncbi:MAG TPA: chemotaxis protein CheB [Polyangiaceae bacterium]|nr:chemotaxis protein CheB [Polyangiaceae bacterium]